MLALIATVAMLGQQQSGFPEIGAYLHDHIIKTNDPGATNRGSLRCDLGVLARDDDWRSTLILYFLYNGDVRPKATLDDKVYMQFGSVSGSWRYLKFRRMAVVADGRRFEYGEPKHDGNVLESGDVDEIFGPFVPIEDLIVWGRAKSVKVFVGVDELDLLPSHRAALLDFAARLGAGRAHDTQADTLHALALEEYAFASLESGIIAAGGVSAFEAKIPKTLTSNAQHDIYKNWAATKSHFWATVHKLPKDKRRRYKAKTLAHLESIVARRNHVSAGTVLSIAVLGYCNGWSAK